MGLRRRLSSVLAIALAGGVVQLVALPSPARAYATPVGDWSSTQVPYNPLARDRHFFTDDTLSLTTFTHDSGVSLVNTANGAKRQVVAVGANETGWYDRGVVSGDGSTVVAQAGPFRSYPNPGNELTVLRGFDPDTLEGGTTTKFTTVPANRTVESMALSKDGSRLAFGGEGVSLLDTTTGVYTEVLPTTGCGSGDPFNSHKVALSDDGTVLADFVGKYCNGGANGTNEARVWDITNPTTPVLVWSKTMQNYSLPLFCSSSDSPTSIALSGDGTKVAVADHRYGELTPTDGYNHDLGTVLVHDLTDATEHTWYDQPGDESGRICSVDLSEDGSRLAIEAADKHSHSPSDQQGDDIRVIDTTTPSATPVQVAVNDFDDGNYGWGLAGITADGSAVLFSGKSRNSGFPLSLWISRDPATVALAWPPGAALTSGQVGQTFAELHWPAATGSVSTYRITGGPTSPVDVPGSETGTTISGLTPGTAYHFEIRARSGGGATTDPLSLDVTTASPAGAGSAALSATVTADDMVRLQWDPKGGVDSYQVLRATGGGAFTQVATAPVGTTQWTDTTTDGATTYTYRVASVTGGVATPHTVDKSVTTAAVALTSVSASPTTSVLYAVPGAPIAIHAVGQPGRTATASVHVVGTSDPAPMTLTETSPGKYDGEATLPAGATTLTNVAVTLADGAGTGTGHTASRTAVLNRVVGAALVAHVETSGFGGRLVASSATGGWSVSQQLSLAADGSRILGVPPADDISVSYVRTSDGQPLGGPSDIGVDAGDVVDLPTRSLSEPATLSLNSGADAYNAKVDLEQGGFSRQVRLDIDGKATVAGLTSGPVTISLAPGDDQRFKFKPFTPVTQNLQVGANSAAPAIQLRELATLDATLIPAVSILDVKNASVTVIQQRDATSVSTVASADASGHVVVPGLIAGLPTRVTVNSWKARVEDPAGIPVDLHPGTNTLDVPVVSTHGYFVYPTLTIVEPDGDATEQVLDWRTAVHYRTTLTTPTGSAGSTVVGSGGATNVAGKPGDQVTFCANGTEGGQNQACVSGVLPPSAATPVHLDLTLTGVGRTRVDYAFRTAGGAVDATRAVQVMATHDTEAVVVDTTIGDGSFSVPSGTWDVTVVDAATSQVLAELPSRTLTGDSADLGTVSLAALAPYTGTGNGIAAQQASVSPGSGLDLNVSWSPSSAQPAGPLTLRLPASVEVPDPSVAVTVDGAPVTATFSAGVLTVPTAAVAAAAAAGGHATVHVRVKDSATAGYVVVRAARSGNQLAAVAVSLPEVTLETPRRVPDRTLALSGRARAGEEVTVVADGLEVGTATATTTGAWRATVTLPPGSQHTLLATSGSATSEPITVHVDRFAPDFKSVTINQEDVRIFTKQPGASYPFVVVPGMPMTVSTTLADGSRISTMDAVLDGVHHPMTRTGNTWSATFQPGFARSAITFDYVEAELPTDLTIDEWTPEKPTFDEYLNSLPTEQAQAIGNDPDVTTSPDHSEATISLPGATAHLKVTDGTGISTTGKRQIAQGVWVLEEPTFSTVGDDLSIKLKLLMTVPDGARDGSRRRGTATKVVETGFLIATSLWADKSAAETLDKYAKLNDLLDQATTCSPGSFNNFRDKIDDLKNAAIGVDVANAALQVGGLVLAPETFGVGTVALWAAGEIMSKIMDSILEDKMDDVRQQMNNDNTCDKRHKPEDFNKKPPRNPDGPRCPGCPGDSPGANPTWIYDPSGVITDGVDPIAGATATLVRSDTEGGQYSVWDAPEFEQINDQVTGDDGAYGWNVPEGWYVVQASAPGRISAQSEALQVLPPRTGVDLVLAPEDLAEVVSTTASGSVITVTFDQWMRTDFLTGSQLTVADAAAAPVTASVVPVLPKVGTDGESYAKSVQLTVPKPSAAKQLTVTVDDGVQDVVGRPMAADGVTTVTVSPPPPKSCTTQQAAASAAAAAVVKAKAAVSKATKSLDKAKKKLKKLKKDGASAAKIKKAKQKVKAATSKLKAARTTLTRANATSATAAQALSACQSSPRTTRGMPQV